MTLLIRQVVTSSLDARLRWSIVNGGVGVLVHRRGQRMGTEERGGLWAWFGQPDADADVVPVGVDAAAVQCERVGGGGYDG